MARELIDRFSQHVAQGRNLRQTAQRDLIARTFFETTGHMSIEELYQQVRKKDPRIGFATVYRTMHLIADAGLAIPRSFGDGLTRYEVAGSKKHHDHLICTGCGRITEFENNKIEQLQNQVATKHGYLVTDHKLELYGLCPECRKSH